MEVKSNRSLSGATRDPRWSASPRDFRRAKLRAWVPVWFFITLLRRSCGRVRGDECVVVWCVWVTISLSHLHPLTQLTPLTLSPSHFPHFLPSHPLTLTLSTHPHLPLNSPSHPLTQLTLSLTLTLSPSYSTHPLTLHSTHPLILILSPSPSHSTHPLTQLTLSPSTQLTLSPSTQLTPSMVHRTLSPIFRVPSMDPTWST